jgi:nitroreductase
VKSILKKILSEQFRKKIYLFRLKVEENLVYLFKRNRKLSQIYYFILSKEFSSENKAVLAGKAKYYADIDEESSAIASSALLRRNIHRIEKGLIMQPRRDVFGESFILETVEMFSKVINSKKLDHKEKKWASDVLTEYFSIVKDTEKIIKARFFYLKAIENVDLNFKCDSPYSFEVDRFKPYKVSELPKVDLSIEQLHQLFSARRSVRWYKDKPVNRDSIEIAIDLAALAPTACNRQPYKFYFSNDKESVTKIAGCAMGTAGFKDNIPAIIAVVGDLSAYPYERDRHVIYIDSSLASMQLLLALQSQGISSCCVNWPDIAENDDKIKNLLGLENHQRVVMLITLGYADPDSSVPFSQKKQNQLLLKDVKL